MMTKFTDFVQYFLPYFFMAHTPLWDNYENKNRFGSFCSSLSSLIWRVFFSLLILFSFNILVYNFKLSNSFYLYFNYFYDGEMNAILHLNAIFVPSILVPSF